MRSEQPTLDQLFAATRSLEGLSPPGRRQVRGRVAARLAAAGVSLSAQALAGEAWLSALKLKVIIGLVVVGGATAGGALFLPRSTSGSNAASRSAADRVAPLQHLPVLPSATKIASVELPVPGTILNEASAPATILKEVPAQASKSNARTGSDALAEELELVRGAQSELSKGRAAKALTLLDQYFQRFPSGILRPEAKVARVRALCLTGRKAEAERQAARFVQNNPDSPLAKRPLSCQEP
jgi:hypothetical protein